MKEEIINEPKLYKVTLSDGNIYLIPISNLEVWYSKMQKPPFKLSNGVEIVEVIEYKNEKEK